MAGCNRINRFIQLTNLSFIKNKCILKFQFEKTIHMRAKMLNRNFTKRHCKHGVAVAVLLAAVLDAHAWTVVVNDTGDTVGGCATTGAGTCTLRDAITYANTNSAAGGDNRIEFNIGGGGEHTIVIGSTALPALAAPAGSLAIDASTQPGYAALSPRRPLITVKAASKGGQGLSIQSATTVRALAIGNFNQGISINGGDNTILGCHIGVDAAGTQPVGNNSGIVLNTGDRNRIGSLEEGGRNIISGATNGDGIYLAWPGKSQDNIIQGNYIGTDITGDIALGNSVSGIRIQYNHDDVVIDSNLVSGNGWGGLGYGAIEISGNRTVLTNNRVGTNASGMAALGNAAAGIEISFTSAGGHKIGLDANSGNLISGNAKEGIVTNGTSGSRNPNMLIAGNIVGLSADERNMLPNLFGIVLKDTDSAAIRGNTVGGHSQTGILLQGSSRNNVVQSNLVGVNAFGESMPNTLGISLWSSAENNLIGGEGPQQGNTIAHSTLYGIALYSDAVKGTSILGNSIYQNNGSGIARTLNANHGQDEPVLNQVLENGVTGTLDSVANESFRIEYFSTPVLPDGTPDAFAAKTLLGVQTVSTDAAGHAQLQFDGAMPPGRVATITAIATRLSTKDSSRISRFKALPNRPPQALPQSVEVGKDSPVAITLAGTDPDGDALSFAIATQPQHGSLGDIDPATGAVTYQPEPGYTGPDTFTFVANDGLVDSDVASVDIVVRNAPLPPPIVKKVPGLQPTPLLVLVLMLAGLAGVRQRHGKD